MSALVILIPVSVLLIAAAIGVFVWAVHHDQFQDLDTPEVIPLLDADTGNEDFVANHKEVVP